MTSEQDLKDRAVRFPWWKRLIRMSGTPETVVYDIASPRWTAPPLTLALLSDLHVASPWAGLRQLDQRIQQVNDMPVDGILLLGDYLADRLMVGRHAPAAEIATRLAQLRAPLGVHAILGNHDWADDLVARRTGYQRSAMAEALEEVGLPPLINAARRVDHGPDGLWLVGLDSQQGHKRRNRGGARHDPERAFADVPPGALNLLMAHEPDYFGTGDTRPVVQVSGHTHGGQITLFGKRFVTASDYGERYVYGHIVEQDRHLVVSGGLGFGGLPIRVTQPPEIVVLRLRGTQDTEQ